jgi:hypothetical protein
MQSNHVRSEALGARAPIPRLNGNKIAAIIFWIAGAVSTWLAAKAFLIDAPWWLPVASALIAQFVLTFAERAIWRGRPSGAGLAALGLDVALNAGGLFPNALKLGETPPAQMVIAVFGGSRQVTPLGAMIAAIIIGFLIAAAPEDLWSRRD